MISKWKYGLGVALGVTCGCLIGLIRNVPAKEWAPIFAAATFVLVLAVARHRERWCVFLFLVTAPLPMHGFLLKLDPVHGGGALGIYVVAADVPLIALYVLWFLEWARRQNGGTYRPNRFIVWFLPFLIMGGLSIIYSVQPLWAACEWLRWLRVLLILFYAIKRFRPSEMNWYLSALAPSTILQSTLAVLQSLTHSHLGLDRLGIFGSGGTEEITQELAGGESLYRGLGLTSHPELLSSYLLLLLPVFALLLLVDRRKPFQLLWSAAFCVGVGGLVATMSRTAWVCFLAVGMLAFILAVFLSILTPKKAIVVCVVVMMSGGVLALTQSSLILKRFHSDFSESWKLRAQLNDTALDIATDFPLGGVGLNNYTLVYPHYDRAFANQMVEMDNLITAVHNVYLLVLAETGVLGLAAFLAFYFRVFWGTSRSMLRMSRFNRAVALGILSGLLAAMLCDLTEISLFFEIVMYTVPVLVGMIEIMAVGEVFENALAGFRSSAALPGVAELQY